MATADPGLTHVYRYFDADDRLLYVGVARQFEARDYVHRHKPWYASVARVAIEQHESRQAALAAELKAILTEDPAHNVMNKPGAFPKRIAPDREPLDFRTVIRLPKSLLERIDEIAEAERRSRNAMVIVLLEEAAQQH